MNKSEDLNIQFYKEKLINYINTNNNIKLEDLKRAYNVVETISNTTYDKLIKIFDGNIEGLKHLINILEITGSKATFLESLIDKKGFPTFEDLKNNNNLFKLIKDKKFSISNIFENENQLDNFLEKLINESYKVAGKGVGAGELFLTTLFKNTEHPNQGDINMDDNEIEVKFSTDFSKNGGRLIPAKGTLKTVDEITDYFEYLLNKKDITDINDIQRNDNNKIIIAGDKYIGNIFKVLETKLSQKEIFELLSKMYFYQFNNLSTKEKEFNEFIKDIKTFSFNTLMQIHGALALISYHEADNWRWLLVGVSQTSDYYIIDGNKCTLDNFSLNLKYLMEDKNYVFKKYPSNTNGAHPMQDKVAQIYVSNKKN